MKLDFLPDMLSYPFIDLEVNYKYLNALGKRATTDYLLLGKPTLFNLAYSISHASRGT